LKRKIKDVDVRGGLTYGSMQIKLENGGLRERKRQKQREVIVID
jgi:hypothetical protein